MTLNIRAATAGDAEAVGRLARQFADYLRSLGDTTDFKLNAQTYLRDGFGTNPGFSGLVAEQDGVIEGVGKALMSAAAKLSRDAGGMELFWSVYVHNKMAASFYLRTDGVYEASNAKGHYSFDSATKAITWLDGPHQKTITKTQIGKRENGAPTAVSGRVDRYSRKIEVCGQCSANCLVCAVYILGH